MRRLVCWLRGHKRDRIITGIRIISAPVSGGVAYEIAESDWGCRRCYTRLTPPPGKARRA